MNHQQKNKTKQKKNQLKVRPPPIYLWLSKVHVCWFLFEYIEFLPIMFTTKSGVVNKIWMCSPISSNPLSAHATQIGLPPNISMRFAID